MALSARGQRQSSRLRDSSDDPSVPSGGHRPERHHRAAADPPGEPVLLVAVCAGRRCQALWALHDPSASASGNCGQLLKKAVRQSPRAILISTGCLGPCARGCVAAVGPGTATEGEICWTGRPVGLSMVEIPERAAALADWITNSAPDLSTLPETLWHVGTS